jgi:hypothetical protein
MCAPIFFGQKAQFAGAHGHELVHASAPTKFTNIVMRFLKIDFRDKKILEPQSPRPPQNAGISKVLGRGWHEQVRARRRVAPLPKTFGLPLFCAFFAFRLTIFCLCVIIMITGINPLRFERRNYQPSRSNGKSVRFRRNRHYRV